MGGVCGSDPWVKQKKSNTFCPEVHSLAYFLDSAVSFRAFPMEATGVSILEAFTYFLDSAVSFPASPMKATGISILEARMFPI